MYNPQSPVASVAKIGPKYQKLLENLGIYTINDLLYHFPFRYDDFSQIKKIKDIQPKENVTVCGMIGNIQNIFTKYGKRISKTKVIDDTGSLEVIWFNSHYLKKILVPNRYYNLSGKADLFSKKMTLISPTYEEVGEDNLSTGRLVPVYPETAGISSKWLRSRINDVLTEQTSMYEFLPNTILIEEKIPELNTALRNFHFPRSIQEAENAKKRFQMEELFIELLNVENRKKVWHENLTAPKHNLLIYEKKINELNEVLPFKLTESQKKAIEEIFSDLKKDRPMNRLLEGDVGTGKTMVAIFAAYLAYLNGYNVLYMAPTEILAQQHFLTFNKFLANFLEKDVVKLITGNKKTDDLSGIIVGTHALLYQGKFDNVGLVIIDEQHRFGVEQRTKLITLNKNKKTPHLLTMTATPIPRTLALTVYGDLEISVLDTPPNKDKKITTKVESENQREEVLQWIKNKNEPTFLVCPFIEESDHESFENVKAATAEFEKLKNGVFKGVNMGLLHGKMKSEEKKKIVENFQKGEIRVLVSTPVIEVGIDIPDATIIVIESAERYGLASLHQLRGRVGRGSKEGFCFIFLSNFSRNSYERLKHLESVNNGLELAEIDLRLRGAGDIYGTMQSGFKQFKVADLSNVAMIERARAYAKHFLDKLDKYPKLRERIEFVTGRYVGNN